VAVTSGNNVTLVDANALDLGASTVSGALSVTAGGAITQTGALTIVGAASFDTSANAAIGTVAITAQNPVGALTVNASQIAGNFTLDVGARDVTFNPNVDVGQNVTVTTTGTITGGANIRAAGTSNALNDATTITATGGSANFDLTQALLNAATGPGVTVNLFGAGYTAATPQAASAINLSLANSIGGPLTITTTNPGIAAGGINDYNLVQSGALNFGGKNITLAARPGVNFAGPNTLNGNNGSLVTLTQANTSLGSIAFNNTYNSSITTAVGNAVTLAASTINGSLTVSSGGALTQTGALIVVGTSSFTAGANPITLTTGTNDFQGVVSLTGGTTQITDTNALTLGTLATGNLTATSTGALNLGTGTVTGTLAATSNGGAITETAGGLTVTGTSNINAGAGAITLTDVANDFQGVVSLTGGTTQITDTNALTLGTLATGNLMATSTGALNLGQGTVTGTLTATSNGGGITQSGALTVTGAGTVNAGVGAITLTTGTNDFQGAMTLTGGTTQITDTNALTLGTLATGNLTATSTGALNLGQGTVTGTLTATSNGGAITQSGALTVTGVATVNAGANTITLANATNDFTGEVSATNTGANAIQLRDANALVLGTVTTGNNLAVTAGGAITQTGVLTVTGTTSLQVTAAGSDILLASQANNLGGAVSLAGTVTNIRDLALRNVNAGAAVPSLAGTTLRDLTLIFDNAAVAMPGATLTGNLSVTAGGTITDSGNLVVAGTTTLAAGAGNDITLDSAGNNFSTVAITSGNNVTLVDANALDLGASTISGALNVTAGGAITQSGALTVAGTTSLRVTAAGSDILLASQANNLGGAVSLAGTVTNIRDLALRNVNGGATVPSLAGATNLRNLTLLFNNAAVALNGVTWTGSLNATAPGITIHALTPPGALGTLNAGAGAITLDIGYVGLNLSTMATSLTGGTLNVCAGPNTCTGGVTTGAGFTFAGNINLGSGMTPITGNVTVAGPLQATGSALTIDATGTITGAGGITTASVNLIGTSIGTNASPLILTNVGTLSGTVTGVTPVIPPALPTEVFNVQSPGTIATIGTIDASAGAGVGAIHPVTIQVTSGGIGTAAGGGTITAAGPVSLLQTTGVATAGLPLTSTEPVTCNGLVCDDFKNEFVNRLGTIFLQQQGQLVSSVLSGIQSALAVNQCGPSGLLCEGVLPENIFKSLGSRVLEVVGGGEDMGEGGELSGVKVHASEEFAPTDDELRKKKRFEGMPR
jgi:hypothetical protein